MLAAWQLPGDVFNLPAAPGAYLSVERQGAGRCPCRAHPVRRFVAAAVSARLP